MRRLVARNFGQRNCRKKQSGFFRYRAALLLVGILALPSLFQRFDCRDKSLASLFSKSPSTTSVDITGKYTCSPAGKTVPFLGSSKAGISICKDKAGKPVMTGPLGGRIRIEQGRGGKFTYTVESSRTGHSGVGAGHLDEKGKLILVERFYGPRRRFNLSAFICEYKEPCPDNLRRAVFIRPCEGQLYKSDGFTTKRTNVGGGTIWRVCTDLKASRVTDVFLPFKVDDEGKGCGNHGELLYDSKNYDTHENQDFAEARERGFDPIKKLIAVCRRVYKEKTRKTIRFHAWFPVFKDPRIIEDLDEKGIEAGQKAEKSGLSCSNPPPYHSDIFADPGVPEVVDYELALLQEIIENYNVDGINLDYIRYAGDWEDKQRPDGSGRPPGYNWVVRPEAVENFIKLARQRIKVTRSNLILSADIFANPVTRITIGQDGVLPDLGMVILMVYSGDIPAQLIGPYATALRAQYPNKILIPALRGWALPVSVDEVQSQEGFLADLKSDIAAVKAAGVNGYAIFTYENVLVGAKAKKFKDIRGEIRY